MDRSIILGDGDVRALLTGRKAEHRVPMRWPSATGGRHNAVPYSPGDRLWVREAFQYRGARYDDGQDGETSWSDDEWFRAWGRAGGCWDPDYPNGWSPPWRMRVTDLTGPEHDEGPEVEGFSSEMQSATHMPRWASRLTLVVTNAHVERLSRITVAGCVSEGVPEGETDPLAAFAAAWDLRAPRQPWSSDPHVVVLSFVVHEANVDRLAGILAMRSNAFAAARPPTP